MKYRRQGPSTASKTKKNVILSNVNVYASYDPEASLMVSQLENPELFIPQSAYLTVDDIPPEVSKFNFTLNFWAVPKTPAFLENKRHLSELLELSEKII